jgi:DNA replication and repair protein RecF
MIIENFAVSGFRNLTDIDIRPDKGLNILFGANAQGKTNLLEALWMLTGVRSFRGAREKEQFGFDTDIMEAVLTFRDSERVQEISVKQNGAYSKKLITLNGVQIPRLSKLFGKLCAVVFTPQDLKLSYGEPRDRRQFLDLSIAQIKVSYASALSRYNRALAQRNSALKTGGDFTLWDEALVKTGAFITVYRNVYIKLLNRVAGGIYSALTGGKEKLCLEYSSVYGESIPDSVEKADTEFYLKMLTSHYNDDMRLKTTCTGVHRDDMVILINNRPVRDYGSQGQMRSASLTLKLAQAKILATERNEPPVVLLDDVLSELDESRRSYILKNLTGFQTFLTGCELSKSGKSFLVKGGSVCEFI